MTGTEGGNGFVSAVVGLDGLEHSEFRAIVAGQMRRLMLTFDQARDVQAEAESLLLDSECEVESQRVFEPVRDSYCSAYDCEFAALAMKLSARRS